MESCNFASLGPFKWQRAIDSFRKPNKVSNLILISDDLDKYVIWNYKNGFDILLT